MSIIEIGRSLAARGLPAFVATDVAATYDTIRREVGGRAARPTDATVNGITFQACGGGRRVIRSTKRFANQ